ncbi:MAG: DUF2934 domain-containing protein [Alphaproteobacteria bacterium]|nr:DUF2934 domain-containing protein [Alphaproteobacteria bacterium]
MIEPARDQAIRDRAYAIWEQDGRPEGRSLDHWLQAEAEIGIAVQTTAKTIKSRRAHGSNKPSTRVQVGERRASA